MVDVFHGNSAPAPALLSRVADVLPWPLVVLQPDATLVYANRAGRELLGRARTLQCSPLGRVEPTRLPRRESFQQALAQARAGERVDVVLAAGPKPCRGRVSRLPGQGPALLLLALGMAQALDLEQLAGR